MWWVGFLACVAPAEPPPPADSATEVPGPGACDSLEGNGGPVRYVVADAGPGGDGTAAAPFPTVAAALAAAESGWDVRVGPGDYDGGLDVSDPARHRGVWVRGCGPEPSVLHGSAYVLGNTDAAIEDLLLGDLELTQALSVWRAYGVVFVGTMGAREMNLDALVLHDASLTVEGALRVSQGDPERMAVTVYDASVDLQGSLTTEGGYSGLLLEGSAHLAVGAGGRVDVGTTTRDAVRVLDEGELDVTGTVVIAAAGGTGLFQNRASRVAVAEGATLEVDTPASYGVYLGGGSLVVDGSLLVDHPGSAGVLLSSSGGGQLTVGAAGLYQAEAPKSCALAVNAGARADLAGTMRVDAAESCAVLASGAGAYVDVASGAVFDLDVPSAALAAEKGATLHVGSTELVGALRGLHAVGGRVEVDGDVVVDTPDEDGAYAGEGTDLSTGVVTILPGASLTVRGGLIAVVAAAGGEVQVAAGAHLEIDGEGVAYGVYVDDGRFLLDGTLTTTATAGPGIFALSSTTGEVHLSAGSSATVQGSVSCGVAVNPLAAFTADGELTVLDSENCGLLATSGALVEVGGQVRVEGAVTGGVVSQTGASVVVGAGGQIDVEGGDFAGVSVSAASFAAEGEVRITGPDDVGVYVTDGGLAHFAWLEVSAPSRTGVLVRDSALALLGGSVVGVRDTGTYGDAIAVERAVGEVELRNLDLDENGRAGVFLSASAARLTDLRVSGNTLGIVQQDCDGVAAATLEAVVLSGNDDDAAHLCDGTTLAAP